MTDGWRESVDLETGLFELLTTSRMDGVRVDTEKLSDCGFLHSSVPPTSEGWRF